MADIYGSMIKALSEQCGKLTMDNRNLQHELKDTKEQLEEAQEKLQKYEEREKFFSSLIDTLGSCGIPCELLPFAQTYTEKILSIHVQSDELHTYDDVESFISSICSFYNCTPESIKIFDEEDVREDKLFIYSFGIMDVFSYESNHEGLYNYLKSKE